MPTEAQKQANRKWRLKNRDRVNSYLRELRKKNPERYKQYQVNYWKKKLASMEESNDDRNA